MFIIGITGGTGSGKTTALQALWDLGARVLDCDAVYHELLEQNVKLGKEIKKAFGNVTTNGMIDRRKLGDIVFYNETALFKLNKITHKYVAERLDKYIKEWSAQGEKLVVIDAIALFESGQDRSCDLIVGITAPYEERIKRIIKRDGISREQAESRIKAQQPDGFYIDNCDHILENIYDSPSEFQEACRNYFNGVIGGKNDADQR